MKEEKISAVIFDLNGTILDDEGVYSLAFTKVLNDLGAKIEGTAYHLLGIGVKENWPILLQKYSIKTDKSMDDLARETQRAYLDFMDKIKVRDGFLDFVLSLKKDKIKVGLATSNTWPVVESVLEKFNLYDYFDSITTSEEVNFNKPEPDLYLLAAEKMGVEPKECIVFEDSPAGIEAAIAAGMHAIGVSVNDDQAGALSDAEKVITSFEELLDEGSLPN